MSNITDDQDEAFREGARKFFEGMPEGVSMGDVIRIQIRNGQDWAARCWASDREVRKTHLDSRNHRDVAWIRLVDMAAKKAGDWIINWEKEGLSGYRPRKHAKIRTRVALVAWLALTYPDIAFAIEDDDTGVMA